jgi:hypothetical protein
VGLGKRWVSFWIKAIALIAKPEDIRLVSTRSWLTKIFSAIALWIANDTVELIGDNITEL